jgi:hypothetical protein
LPVDSFGQIVPLDVAGSVGVVGNIGVGPAGAADVNFYEFTLTSAANVHLATVDQGVSGFVSVLGLYVADPSMPYGFRLLAQDDGAAHGGDAVLNQALPQGTYFVAVSGSGNRYFFPYLPDSGFYGSTGAYGLLLSANDLPPSNNPFVLGANVSNGAVLHGAPTTLTVDFSDVVDPNALNVQLTNLQTGNPVSLAFVNFDLAGNQLQITPNAPLSPGSYQLFIPGANNGTDYLVNFQVDGQEGIAGATSANDTALFAQPLPNLAGVGLFQVGGFLGDDPYYDPALFDSQGNPLNPANDVDLYHFHVGPGNFALGAEVFAGRIGSGLDPALTLFKADAFGNLHFVASNGNTGNGSSAMVNGIPYVPLSTDAALFAGLTEGDYYLAVSSGFNYWDPGGGLTPALAGVFDPAQAHSGTGGNSTGAYVLNLLLQPAVQPPHVAAVTPAAGTLSGPPTTVTVRFDAPVNLELSAFSASYQGTPVGSLPGVFVQGVSDPSFYTAPRLINYDPSTNTATFALLDALPPGASELHLQPQYVTDLAGNPLVANDPSGDFVVRFDVQGPPRGSAGNPLLWQDVGLNQTPDSPQVLGPLFPNEMANGHAVTIVRDFSAAPANAPQGTADYYQLNLLQEADYQFSFAQATGLNASTPNVYLVTYDANGTRVLTPQAVLPNGQAHLTAGTYLIEVTDFTDTGAGVAYQLNLTLLSAPDQPIPLVVGPRPALRLQLVGTPNTPRPEPPLPVTSTSTGSDGLAGVSLALGRQSLGGIGEDAVLSPAPAGGLVRLSGPETPGAGVALMIVTQALSGGDLLGEATADALGPIFQTALNSLQTLGERAVLALEEVGSALAGAGEAANGDLRELVDGFFAALGAEDGASQTADERGVAETLPTLTAKSVMAEELTPPLTVAGRGSVLTGLAWAAALGLSGSLAVVGTRRLRARRQVPAVG